LSWSDSRQKCSSRRWTPAKSRRAACRSVFQLGNYPNQQTTGAKPPKRADHGLRLRSRHLFFYEKKVMAPRGAMGRQRITQPSAKPVDMSFCNQHLKKFWHVLRICLAWPRFLRICLARAREETQSLVDPLRAVLYPGEINPIKILTGKRQSFFDEL